EAGDEERAGRVVDERAEEAAEVGTAEGDAHGAGEGRLVEGQDRGEVVGGRLGELHPVGRVHLEVGAGRGGAAHGSWATSRRGWSKRGPRRPGRRVGAPSSPPAWTSRREEGRGRRATVRPMVRPRATGNAGVVITAPLNMPRTRKST